MVASRRVAPCPPLSGGLPGLAEGLHSTKVMRADHSFAGLRSLFALALVLTWWPVAALAGGWLTTFDTVESVAWWWIPPYGTPAPSAGWDGLQDSGGNPASGSLQCSEVFTGQGFEYFMVSLLFLDTSNRPVVLNGWSYVYLSFDLKVAPTAAPSTSGDFGWLQVGFISTNLAHWDVSGLASPVQIPLRSTNWTRFTVPVVPSTPDLDALCGLKLSMVSLSNTWTRLPNTVSLNLDNLGLYGMCCPPPGQPVLRVLGTTGTDLRLRWPASWTNFIVQASPDLRAWVSTGLETNAVRSGDDWEVSVPTSALPSPGTGFWRLRSRQP